jgi:hypothetical protein
MEEETVTLTLELNPELEERLSREARRQGVPADAYTLKLLEEHLPPSTRSSELTDLLQAWIEENDEGQQEQVQTAEYLIRVLDEDRPSERKLFPPELRGVTW